MKRMTILAGLSALMLVAPAVAQVAAPSGLTPPVGETPEFKQQKREAAAKLLKLMRPVWTDEQIGRIMYMGWYSGAAALCDDLEIDPVKMTKALNSLEAEKTAGASPEKIQFLERNLMLHVGIATGWVIAGHVRDVPKLCAEARQTKAEVPADRHLFEVTPAPAAKP